MSKVAAIMALLCPFVTSAGVSASAVVSQSRCQADNLLIPDEVSLAQRRMNLHHRQSTQSMPAPAHNRDSPDPVHGWSPSIDSTNQCYSLPNGLQTQGVLPKDRDQECDGVAKESISKTLEHSKRLLAFKEAVKMPWAKFLRDDFQLNEWLEALPAIAASMASMSMALRKDLCNQVGIGEFAQDIVSNLAMLRPALTPFTKDMAQMLPRLLGKAKEPENKGFHDKFEEMVGESLHSSLIKPLQIMANLGSFTEKIAGEAEKNKCNSNTEGADEAAKSVQEMMVMVDDESALKSKQDRFQATCKKKKWMYNNKSGACISPDHCVFTVDKTWKEQQEECDKKLLEENA